MNSTKIRQTVFAAVFAALICASCIISVPLPGGVPISLQNFFCILAGAVLGSARGFFAVCAWILLGICGVPVFSNARGGLGVVLGPTGGYILGYALGSLFAGILLKSPKIGENLRSAKRIVFIVIVLFLSYAIVYLPGIPRFMQVMGAKGNPQTFKNALALTLLPFIPGDLIKLFITIPLLIVFRPIIAGYLNTESIQNEKDALRKLEEIEKNDENQKTQN